MAHEPMDATLFTKSRKADYWNDFYQRPANLFEHTMVQRRDYAHRYICEKLGKDAKLLDLGCGAGVLSEQLLKSGYRITAADASEDMLELARRRLGSGSFPADSYRTLQADIMSLPFEDGSFDAVICMGVFGYFDNVDRALAEVRRVLKPGGTLFMSVRNSYNLYLCDIARLPFRLMRFAGKKLFGRLLPKREDSKPATAKEGSSMLSSSQSGFRIDIHQDPRLAIEGITNRGYSLLEFDGLGYGPLTFFGKEFLPAAVSIKLSDGLNKIFRRTGLQQRARWIADVSFYMFRKNA